MTPMLFSRGLADSGSWGDKYFGRILTETLHIGEGCTHKTSKAKVIYGLDPVFESGSTCIIKIRNPIAYGTKQESNLAERNLEITKQVSRISNLPSHLLVIRIAMHVKFCVLAGMQNPKHDQRIQ